MRIGASRHTRLEKENLFYRMLPISALTGCRKPTGDAKYED